MHESELVNCEKTPSEGGLEHAAESRTHTLTRIDMNFISNHFVAPKGTRDVNPGQTETPRHTWEGDRGRSSNAVQLLK